jgi:hypothetical protein
MFFSRFAEEDHLHHPKNVNDGEEEARKSDACHDPLCQRGADHAVDHALDGRLDDIHQALRRVAADALHALAQLCHEPLAVSVEEKRDQYA